MWMGIVPAAHISRLPLCPFQISLKTELIFHLLTYTALICTQLIIQRHSLTALPWPFLCYIAIASISLLLGCQAWRHKARLLLVPILLVVIFDILRFVMCAVSMVVGSRSPVHRHCKVWFLYDHRKTESYPWAAFYVILSLYLYCIAAALNKYLGGITYRPLPVVPRELPLIYSDVSTVSHNVDSPPRYASIVKKQETPPPRYLDLKESRI